MRHLRSLPRGFEKSRSVRESLSVKERSTKSGHHPLSTSSVSAGIERGISYEGGGGGVQTDRREVVNIPPSSPPPLGKKDEIEK